MNQVQDIRVVCEGTKDRVHNPTDVALIGWNPHAKRPEHLFLAYAGPTPYGRSRPPLWQPGRPVEYGITFRFNTCEHCNRDTPLSFKVLSKYAEALQAAGDFDLEGRLTLNLSSPPHIIG
jgi:hypothetical protein